MTQGNPSQNRLVKILESAAIAGVIALLALIFQVYSSYKQGQDTEKELNNQALQIAQQQTQIALDAEQNQLQSQSLTLAAQQSNIERQYITPPSDNGDFALTATAIESTRQAIATRVAELESIAIALETKQSIPQNGLIYEDTFDTPSGWYLKEGVKIENGNLLVYPGRDAVPDFSNTFTDFTFESRFYISESGSMAFYFRNQVPTCQNGNWNCSIQIVLDFNSPSQIFVARRYLGNTLSPVDITRSSGNVLRSNDWNEILVTTKGSNYKVYINRSLVLEFSENEYASGSFIIDNDPNSNSEIKLDYIRIYKVQ
jgi:hypothetical protein